MQDSPSLSSKHLANELNKFENILQLVSLLRSEIESERDKITKQLSALQELLAVTDNDDLHKSIINQCHQKLSANIDPDTLLTDMEEFCTKSVSKHATHQSTTFWTGQAAFNSQVQNAMQIVNNCLMLHNNAINIDYNNKKTIQSAVKALKQQKNILNTMDSQIQETQVTYNQNHRKIMPVASGDNSPIHNLDKIIDVVENNQHYNSAIIELIANGNSQLELYDQEIKNLALENIPVSNVLNT